MLQDRLALDRLEMLVRLTGESGDASRSMTVVAHAAVGRGGPRVGRGPGR